MDRRPLALAAGCYGLGAAVAWTTGAPPILWLLGFAVILLLLALRKKAVLVFCAMMLLGAMITSGAFLLPSLEAREGAVITGQIVAEPIVKEKNTVVTLSDVTIDGTRQAYGIRIYVYDPVDLKLGNFVEVTGNTWLPARQTNPGGFDFAMWLWKDNIALCATANAEAVRVTRDASVHPSFQVLLSEWRSAIGRLIDELFPKQAALVRALVIGDRALLPEDLVEDFRKSGVSHVLAVSGLHISCLAFAIDWLLRKLSASPKAAYAAVLGSVLVYAAVVGFPASVLRAALMYALARGAPLSGRSSDGLTGLAAAFLLLLLIKPLYIADYGFILSFSAVAGLMLLAPVLSRMARLPDSFLKRRPIVRKVIVYILSLLCASAAAQLGTLPAVATLYGRFSTWALLGNLVAVPLTVAALPLAMLSLLIGALSPIAGSIVAQVPDGMLNWLGENIGNLARLPFAEIVLPAWPAALCVAYALCCLICSPYVAIRESLRRGMLLSLPLIACLSVAVNLAALPKGFTTVFLDAGQADAAVVHAQGNLYLVDVGDENSPTDDYLRYHGVGYVKGAFLSHPHSDHVAGLKEVLSQTAIGTIYVSPQRYAVDADPGIAELLRLAEANGSEIVTLGAGKGISLSESIVATVHQPDAETKITDANAASMVLRITYGEGSALFTGDLTRAAEKLPMPDCDVLKVAHHGSSGSTSELMLMTSTPSVAVLSVGRNSFGHPTDAVLSRIAESGAAVYRTDQCGAITIHLEMDGAAAVSTYKTPEDERG